MRDIACHGVCSGRVEVMHDQRVAHGIGNCGPVQFGGHAGSLCEFGRNIGAIRKCAGSNGQSNQSSTTAAATTTTTAASTTASAAALTTTRGTARSALAAGRT